MPKQPFSPLHAHIKVREPFPVKFRREKISESSGCQVQGCVGRGPIAKECGRLLEAGKDIAAYSSPMPPEWHAAMLTPVKAMFNSQL